MNESDNFFTSPLFISISKIRNIIFLYIGVTFNIYFKKQAKSFLFLISK
jgi:hypothetical protein